MPSERSKEDVFDLLAHATSDVTGFHNRAQLLTVNPQPEAPDLLLMEVTPAMADQLLTSGPNFDFCFKSFKDSSQPQAAYLCSDGKTFKLLEAETSNSLLIAPKLWIPTKKDSEAPAVEPFVTKTNIAAIKSCYLETVAVRAPPLNKLKQLLISSSFAGHIEEDDRDDSAPSQFYSFQELLENVPCSKSELIAALDRLNVMLWEGKCRIFEVDYLNAVIQAIFDLVDENAWNWSKEGLPAATIVLSLSKLYPASVTRQVFHRFFYRRRSAAVRAGHVFPRIGKICQLVGEHLLSVTSKFALQDFFSVWSAAVPRGMRPRLRQHLTCVGRAVCESHLELAPAGGPNKADGTADRAHRGQSISLLRSEDLPDESVEARLEVLFARQAVLRSTADH
uniref:Sister chromatid cohesion protein DCC1 n=1 Tax=Schistocephalus solidus TaxID=70667 RepID=A0A0X3Q5K7_SCHSO